MANRSRKRVLAALNFQRPDILRLFEHYWPEFTEQWRTAKGLTKTDVHMVSDYYGNDRITDAGDESPWPSLPRGSRADITAHVRELAELGRDGGLVLGGHSIGPSISVKHYEWAMAARQKYGAYDQMSTTNSSS